MKIGIIGAMEEEVTLLRDKIENRQTISLGGCEIYTGQLNGTEVALLKSGIGKVAAALGATLLLEHCKPDVIINTGSAGGLAPTLKVGDIVVSDEARYHDADVTAFGYEYGQLPGCPAGFKADDKLIAAAEACIAELNLNAVRGLIVSGDAFINGSVGLAKIRHNFPQAIAVEMEATAIAHGVEFYSSVRMTLRNSDRSTSGQNGVFLMISACSGACSGATNFMLLSPEIKGGGRGFDVAVPFATPCRPCAGARSVSGCHCAVCAPAAVCLFSRHSGDRAVTHG